MIDFTLRPVGEAALLVDFGDKVDPEINQHVLATDAALRDATPIGLRENVPALSTLLILFNPELTDMAKMEAAVREAIGKAAHRETEAAEHIIPVCYEGKHAPDIDVLAERLAISTDDVAKLHAGEDYRVLMYGFAPGYAYLSGISGPLAVPRKTAAVRGHAVGSVMIAAGQCIIMPLPMPTGWWVIGRTATRILRPESEDPFLFKPGDRVRFQPIGRDELERQLEP